MKVKILSYNILNGFCNDLPPYELDKKRMSEALKIISSFNPDILILTEGYFWPIAKQISSKGFKNELNSMFNEYTSYAKNSFRFAPIILSKFPIKEVDISKSLFQLNLLSSKVKIGKKELSIHAFHPHPNIKEEYKAKFLENNLKDIKTHSIIAGDFNALSPEDNYDKKRLLKGFQKFMGEKAKEKVKDLLSFSSIRKILELDFVDSYKTKKEDFDFTMPTDLRSKDKTSSIRIDYIFCSKDLKVADAGIIKNSTTEKASDHYPIFSIIEI